MFNTGIMGWRESGKGGVGLCGVVMFDVRNLSYEYSYVASFQSQVWCCVQITGLLSPFSLYSICILRVQQAQIEP